MVNRSRTIGVIAWPVDDHKPDIGALNQQAPGFGTALQQAAYQARLDIAGVLPHPLPPMRHVPNKVNFEHITPVLLPAEHPHAEGQPRWSLAFKPVNGDGSSQQFLLPRDSEGFRTILRNPPQTAEDVRDTLAPYPVIGGNTGNVALNQARMTEALQEIDADLRLCAVVPNDNALATVLKSEKERYRAFLDLHLLEGFPRRWGLHIPHVLQHEDGRTQTFMLNRAPPPSETVNAALEQFRSRLEGCKTIFAPEDFPVLDESDSAVLPTSAVMGKLRLSPRSQLLVNDEELGRILDTHGFPTHLAEGECLLPSIVTERGIDSRALASTNHHIQQLLTLMDIPGSPAEPDLRRLAHIGKQDKHSLDLYRTGHTVIAVEMAQMHEAGLDALLERAGSDRIARHLQEGTGRGDASASAELIRHVPLKRLLRWWERQHPGVHVDLPPAQKRLMRMLLPAILGRSHGTLVHFCPDSNFHDALTAEQYRRILDGAIQQALEMASQERDPIHDQPQILEDTSSGLRAGTWIVPDADHIRSAA